MRLSLHIRLQLPRTDDLSVGGGRLSQSAVPTPAPAAVGLREYGVHRSAAPWQRYDKGFWRGPTAQELIGRLALVAMVVLIRVYSVP